MDIRARYLDEMLREMRACRYACQRKTSITYTCRVMCAAVCCRGASLISLPHIIGI